MLHQKTKMIFSYLLCLLVFVSSPVKATSSLEVLQEKEVQQLLLDEKYIVILLSDSEECSGKCHQLEDTLAAIREDIVESCNAWVVRTHSPAMSEQFGLTVTKSGASVVFVRSGIPLLYTGPVDDDEYMLHFLVTNIESALHTLSDVSFEHETQASTGATTGDWLVMFTRNDCPVCTQLRATLEAVAGSLRNRKNVAIVNRDIDGGQTTRRFGVKDFPSFLLFRLGRLYRFDLPLLDAGTLAAFASDNFRNARAEDIPNPKTPFDDLTEQCADWLRENPSVVNAVLCAGVGLLLVTVIAVAGFHKSSTPKKVTESKKKK